MSAPNPTYCQPSDLLGLLAVPNAAWGAEGSTAGLPTETAVAELICGYERVIDGMCRARYAVPFASVPEDITRICIALCLGELLPAIHINKPEQHDRAKGRTAWAQGLLDRLQQGRYSLESSDDASPATDGAPVIVAATTTPRMFSMEDPY